MYNYERQLTEETPDVETIPEEVETPSETESDDPYKVPRPDIEANPEPKA